ncbi:energy transducer TonB [bacterium]|nr:energy transducer TonB [bacterium]
MKFNVLLISGLSLLGFAACIKTADPGELDSPIKIVATKAPEYSDEARKSEREGTVIVEMLVDTDGKVIEKKIVESSGHTDLDNAALEAASGWSFSAPVSAGKNVRTKISVPFEFVTIIPYDELDVKPEPLTQVKPSYPEDAKAGGHEGQALVQAILGKDGKPEETTLKQSSGFEELDNAALDAAARWTFKPAMKQGNAVKTSVVIPFSFKLD